MDLLPISSEIRLNVPTLILTTAKKVTSAATVRTTVLHSGKGATSTWDGVVQCTTCATVPSEPGGGLGI